MDQLVLFVFLKFFIEWQWFSVSKRIVRRSDDYDVISFVVLNIFVESRPVVEVTKHQSEVPISAHASVE